MATGSARTWYKYEGLLSCSRKTQVDSGPQLKNQPLDFGLLAWPQDWNAEAGGVNSRNPSYQPLPWFPS